ncbi:MAG: hypothetical protein K2P04_08760 [Oscillospiraceae bacterium]|nr:hypothetical protein [Oscillospiraceae bacterium]
MKKLWTHLGSNRLLFLSTLTVGLLYCLNSVILPNASGVLVNQVAAAAPLSLGLFLPFLSVSLLQIALSILDDYMSKRLTRKHKQLLRKRAFEGFSLAERYGREDAASFVSFINNDIPSLVEQYFAGMIDIAKCVSLILFSAVSLLSIHWLLAAVIAAPTEVLAYLLHGRNAASPLLKQLEDFTSTRAAPPKQPVPGRFRSWRQTMSPIRLESSKSSGTPPPCSALERNTSSPARAAAANPRFCGCWPRWETWDTPAQSA